MIMNISGAALTRINQAVGFKLVAKAGSAGVVNLAEVVPFVGGLVGGGFDGGHPGHRVRGQEDVHTHR